jgi:ABC-type glycerol-3-phosphate transport system permease component
MMTKNRKINKTIVRIISYVLLAFGAVICLFPLYWMVSTSLMTNVEAQIAGVWWPSVPQWDNYVAIFTRFPFGRWTLNTSTVVFWSVVGTILSNTIVAYGFARFRAPGSNVLFMIALSAMMLPETVTMIPQFQIFSELDWVNTFLPLTVPTFFTNPFAIFLLRQFFMTIPTELEEAAKIDGLGTFGILGKILIPLILPALTALAIFEFSSKWNDFMRPLIYLRSADNFTLALGISFFSSEQHVQWNYLMAASTIAIIPPLVIFFIGQKHFIEGIALSSGSKG